MALNSITTMKPKSYKSYAAKMKHYFHKISFAAIITKSDGSTEVLDLSDVIFLFKIFHMYNDFKFPIVSVSLNLTPNQHTLISDNLEKLKFRLNLEKIEVADISDASKVLEKTGEVVYKDLILQLADYDKSRFRDESEQYNGGFQDALKIQVDLELFKPEHLDIVKQPISGIYNNVKTDSLMIHLLSKSKQKMLIQKSNRKDELLKQVVLPGKNLVQTMTYLQETYGIYKSGLRLFFDFNRGYCLTHDIIENEPISEEEPIEYKNVICYIGKASTEDSGCYLDEETKTYYLLMPNSDKLIFADRSSKDFYGNKMVIKSNNQSKNTMNTTTLENNFVTENSSTKNTTLTTKTITENKSYTIKSGDTLSSIARNNNISVAELAAHNNISNVNSIYTGQNINIPITTTSTVSTSQELSQVSSGVAPDNPEQKVKYYFNNSSNDYTENEMLSNIARNELKYEGCFKDIDFTYLSMNKTIYLSFLDDSYSDYNGMYEAENLATVFTKVGRNMYETDSIVSFARLTKDYLSFT